MLSLNYAINSTTLSAQNAIIRSPVNRQQTSKKQQTRRKRPKNTTLTTITTTSFISTYTTNLTSSTLHSFISSTQQQQVAFEDTYSAKTGIKIAALLGGMLLFCILYLLWKARTRLFCSSSSGIGNSRLSATKFDLDYWLKQVDLLEAKEAERNRGGQSLYLELPNIEPRDNREATALWIVDAYRQWRLIQYRQQQRLLRKNTTPQPEISPIHNRRRPNPLRRFLRRFFINRRQHSMILLEHAQSLINEMRPSIVSNHFFPPPTIPNIPIRRTASWPRMKSSHHHQLGAPMSALQTHLARKRLLKRTSRTTIDL